MMLKSRFTALLGAGALLFACLPATAADYSVSPIPVAHPVGTKTGTITIRNKDTQPVHLSVRVFAWKQSASSSMVLTPDTTLVVYPRTLNVAPGEERVVRIGLPTTPITTEVAYRVLLEQLPDPKAVLNVKGSGVVVRTNIGVPVFVEPLKPTAGQKLDGAKLGANALDVTVENDGNVHIEPTSVTAVGTDASGKQTFSVTIPGWYVLAGATQSFHFAVPAGACASTKSVSVTAGTGHNVFKGSTTQITRSCT
ncbi:MAG: molecular chaperone [Candidatus Eremiobacteraeota bacterium]|nr:molecular chaperone [Candidatus Eremiobacteraeota bacterium]